MQKHFWIGDFCHILGKHPENRKEKALFLGEAACKLLELKLGWISPDDKDHYGNKVIKFAGQMLADLFRTAFRNLVRDMKYQLERFGSKKRYQCSCCSNSSWNYYQIN